MSTETPSLADVIELFMHVDRATLHVSVPARVVRYDQDNQTADLEPMTNRVSRNADDERIVDTLPVLSGIPVAWPRGAGYFMHFPLDPGDSGLLVFTDTDIGAWRATGEVSDPGDERRHALGGAAFYPGLETVKRRLTSIGAIGHLVIGKEGGDATIGLDGSFVQLGDTGGFPVLINSPDFATWITAITGAVNGLAPGSAVVPTAHTATLVKAK